MIWWPFGFEYGYVMDHRRYKAKRRRGKVYICRWLPSTIWMGHWNYKWVLDTTGYKFNKNKI